MRGSTARRNAGPIADVPFLEGTAVANAGAGGRQTAAACRDRSGRGYFRVGSANVMNERAYRVNQALSFVTQTAYFWPALTFFLLVLRFLNFSSQQR